MTDTPTEPIGLPHFMGVAEVAERLGKTDSTIRRWVRLYGMPVHQPGGFRSPLMFDPDEVTAWIRSRYIANRPAAAPVVLRAVDSDGEAVA